MRVRTALLEGKAAALLQPFCLGAVFRELLSFRNNKIQHIDYTPHKKEKGKRKKNNQKRLNSLQTLLKLVLRIYRLETLDGGGSEEVEKSCVYPSGTTEGTNTLSFHRHDPRLLLVKYQNYSVHSATKQDPSCGQMSSINRLIFCLYLIIHEGNSIFHWCPWKDFFWT